MSTKKENVKGGEGKEMENSTGPVIKDSELSIEVDKTYSEEEGEQAYGVYMSTSDKILLGIFWDEELAKFFMQSLKDSDLLHTLEKQVK